MSAATEGLVGTEEGQKHAGGECCVCPEPWTPRHCPALPGSRDINTPCLSSVFTRVNHTWTLIIYWNQLPSFYPELKALCTNTELSGARCGQLWEQNGIFSSASILRFWCQCYGPCCRHSDLLMIRSHGLDLINVSLTGLPISFLCRKSSFFPPMISFDYVLLCLESRVWWLCRCHGPCFPRDYERPVTSS